MNRTIASFTLASFTLALTFGLAACSGDDGATSASTTNSGGTTTTPGTTTDPTAATESTGDTDTGTTDDPSATDTDPSTTDPSATDTDPTSTTDPSTTDASATDTDSGTTDSGTDSDTDDPTGGVDSKWPPLDPMMPMMPCPDGYAAASFVMGGAVCAPKCTGVGKMCPSGDTGTAKGVCAFNPDSSGDECMMGDMCETEGEMCQQTGGGGYACLAPTSHCVLLCNGGESCPEGMMCFGNLVCQYPL